MRVKIVPDPKIFFLIIFGVFGLAFNSLAYNDSTTHPALTQEIIKFYNQFYQPKISEEEMKIIMLGSTEEDHPQVRTLNHFYDPVYKRGLRASSNDLFSPFLTFLLPFIKSSKEWAQNSYVQATFLGEFYSW